MATHYTPDDREAALKLYQVNHLEPSGVGNEFFFWTNIGAYTKIPTGTDRDTAFQDVATALSITLTGTSPWLREQEFWAAFLALPPTAVA